MNIDNYIPIPPVPKWLTVFTRMPWARHPIYIYIYIQRERERYVYYLLPIHKNTYNSNNIIYSAPRPCPHQPPSQEKTKYIYIQRERERYTYFTAFLKAQRQRYTYFTTFLNAQRQRYMYFKTFLKAQRQKPMCFTTLLRAQRQETTVLLRRKAQTHIFDCKNL